MSGCCSSSSCSRSSLLRFYTRTARLRRRPIRSAACGPRGESMLNLAGQAIRAVALGVVVTAVVQSGLAGIGLAIAGVPFVRILIALMFILGIAQVGAGPVLIAA